MARAAEPFYFGEDDRRLFGIFDPADAGSERELATVVCQPLGQEYMRAHRAFVKLAGNLAAAGYSTLRFDYYGDGDSEGDAESWTLDGLLEDVATAMDEVAEGGSPCLCLVGLRLGATLAALAAAQRGGVKALVLWDPVVRGDDYLEQLKDQHRTWLSGSFAKPEEGSGPSRELMGFPLSQAFERDLARLDLGALTKPPAEHILWIDSGEQRERESVADRFAAAGARVARLHLPTPPVWLKVEGGEDFSAGLVPAEVLNAVVHWLGEQGA